MTNPTNRSDFWRHIRPRVIRNGALRFKATFCMGGFSFLAFLVLVGSGVLLMFYYLPGSNAFTSLTEIDSVRPYGHVLRSVHFWAGQMMVVTVFFHMVRVVWRQAYRPPRELNWVIGVMLFAITLVLDFTGYLLRGNQESGAAAAVGQALLKVLPGGGVISPIIFGLPNPLNGSTLVIYVWHCVLLTGLLGILQVWHFWRIRRDGGVQPL